MRRIYLDNAATTPLLPEVRDFLCRSLEVYGNPSSPHLLGEEARELLELARENLASLLNVSPSEIVFNSGATEGNNTVLRSLLSGGRRGNVVVSAIEHKSVSATAAYLGKRGIEVREALVDKSGVVDLDSLSSLIDGNTLLVSVMSVSNEFGTVQPLRDTVELCEDRGVPLHTDAVQAAGKVRLSLDGVSYATFSGHKFHAPKGVGFMLVREDKRLEPLLLGGGQERGFRSGTENLHGILAMARALEVIYDNFEENTQKLRKMRDTFEELLLEEVPDAKVVGKHAPRNPSVSAVIFPRVAGSELVRRLSEEGVFCSAGSACSSGEVVPNEHLLKMGYTPEEASRMVRFSFGLMNTEEDVQEALEKLLRVL
ncbi:cysteine desulfurase family protein [Hydrogenivirga sp.]